LSISSNFKQKESTLMSNWWWYSSSSWCKIWPQNN